MCRSSLASSSRWTSSSSRSIVHVVVFIIQFIEELKVTKRSVTNIISFDHGWLVNSIKWEKNVNSSISFGQIKNRGIFQLKGWMDALHVVHAMSLIECRSWRHIIVLHCWSCFYILQTLYSNVKTRPIIVYSVLCSITRNKVCGWWWMCEDLLKPIITIPKKWRGWYHRRSKWQAVVWDDPVEREQIDIQLPLNQQEQEHRSSIISITTPAATAV